MRARDTEAVTLIATAQAQWWQLVRNRRRWRAARALFAENDRDLAIVARAWEAMSRSERAAETAHVLRGAAVRRSPSAGSHGGASGS